MVSTCKYIDVFGVGMILLISNEHIYFNNQEQREFYIQLINSMTSSDIPYDRFSMDDTVKFISGYLSNVDSDKMNKMNLMDLSGGSNKKPAFGMRMKKYKPDDIRNDYNRKKLMVDYLGSIIKDKKNGKYKKERVIGFSKKL